MSHTIDLNIPLTSAERLAPKPSKIYFTVEPMPGHFLEEVILEMIGLADRMKISVVANLNTVRTVVHPGSNGAAVYAAWGDALKARSAKERPKIGD